MAKKKAVEALLTKYKKGHNEYAEISDVAKEFIDVWKRMTTISEESIATAKMILKLTSIIEEGNCLLNKPRPIFRAGLGLLPWRPFSALKWGRGLPP